LYSIRENYTKFAWTCLSNAPMRMMGYHKMASPYFVILLFYVCSLNLHGQAYHAQIHFGGFYYQGDLSPDPIDLSFGPGNICWGVSSGINVTDWMSLNSRIMFGKISGNDAFSEDLSKKTRNLSFTSVLNEYGIYTDLKVNKIWKSLDKYKIRLYVTAGINLIHFNPKANFEGRWIALQPLGTEGQALPYTGKKKYSLYNFSRPLGIIVEFDINRRMAFGMEVSPRKTWTDYLDDVSGTYVNYEELLASGNSMGAKLANRMGEYLKTEPVRVPTGTLRGKPDKNDWYTHFGLYFKFRFGKIQKNEDENSVLTEIQII